MTAAGMFCTRTRFVGEVFSDFFDLMGQTFCLLFLAGAIGGLKSLHHFRHMLLSFALSTTAWLLAIMVLPTLAVRMRIAFCCRVVSLLTLCRMIAAGLWFAVTFGMFPSLRMGSGISLAMGTFTQFIGHVFTGFAQFGRQLPGFIRLAFALCPQQSFVQFADFL